MLLFLFQHLVLRWSDWCILPPLIYIEFHSNVNLCPVLSLKAYVCHTEPFWKKLDGSRVCFLFLSNNKQNMPICATVSSRVTNVLDIERHASLGTINGAAVLAALVASVSQVSILQIGDFAWVSTTARHYFSHCIITIDQHQDSIQWAFLGLSE